MAVSASVHARIITVSNSPLNPGQFPSVILAMSIAFTGDTLYIHGSPINYGSIDFFMPGIVVIGPGHTPQKQFPFVASFTSINVYADNCQLIGLVAENIQSTFNAITVKRCKILGSSLGYPGINIPGGGSGTFLLEGNVFTGGNSSPNVRFPVGSGDIIFLQNNIFSSVVDTNMGAGTPSAFQIVNNIFLGGGNAFYFIDKATINNNIFYGSSPYVPLSSTITMSNNISFQCGFDLFSTGPNITLSNNLEAVDPQFVNFPGFNAVFSFFHDYHLAPGSPCLASGSDGTDRGVYGGFGTNFNMTGEPAIAEISSVTITSPTTVAPGGTLNVTIVSRRVH